MHVAVLLIALLFAVFTGVNDGGAMLVSSLNAASVRPLTAMVLLVVAVITAPALFGTQVATTLANRLVTFPVAQREPALLLAVLGAVTVVVVLARGGTATSLTLALLGGILGVGVGGGLPIAWTWVVTVVVLAALAPLVGIAAAFFLARTWVALPLLGPVGGQAARVHRLGLLLQTFAYGANDGQKMLAVVTLAAAGTQRGPVVVRPLTLVLVGGLFGLGMLLGARRYSGGLTTLVRAITPMHAAGAQLAAAMTVAGSAAAGAPVSMTQSLTGALIGSTLTEGTGRVRWHRVAAIAAGWAITLPVAGVVAGLPATLVVR